RRTVDEPRGDPDVTAAHRARAPSRPLVVRPAHRTSMGEAVPLRQDASALFEVDVVGSVLALDLLDEVGDVDGFLGAAHGGRHGDADGPVDDLRLDRLAAAPSAHHLDGQRGTRLAAMGDAHVTCTATVRSSSSSSNVTRSPSTKPA